ncbi:MAG: PAS domain S-box protein [Nitrospinae bacterium]|nr:PAS domain S-box protein [Nitrospinota bacterium]
MTDRVTITDAPLARRVRTLLAGRLAVVSFFMGVVVYYQVFYVEKGHPLYGLIPVAIAYGVSILYAVALPFIRRLREFVFLQLLLDVFLVSGVVHFTGGLNSPFSFLYLLVIIAAAILLSKAAIFFMAFISSVAYSALLGLESFGLIAPYYAFTPAIEPKNIGYVQMKALINTALNFIVAYLSSYLGDLLRASDAKLTRASQDFTMLQAFNENVLRTMASGFLAFDFDGQLLSDNPAARRILGYDDDQMKRIPVDRLLHLPPLRAFCRRAETEKASGDQFSWRYPQPGGAETELNMNVSVFDVDGEPQGIIAVIQDVTMIKDMERQMASAHRLAAIGRVAAGVAHEIRNPLASLSGAIQMIGGDVEPHLDDAGKRLMNIIHREIERLNRIVTQFLDYAGPVRLHKTPTDLSRLTEDTLLLLRSSGEAMDEVEIVEALPPGLTVPVDQEQIRQVLWNLCRNALEAMDHRGVLSVTARRLEGGDVEVVIGDNGPGIAPENRIRIFDPFFTTKPGGTGLGLATSHKIVESHGGALTVETPAAGGALFALRLPGAPQDQPPAVV